jgi:hypothetical protein
MSAVPPVRYRDGWLAWQAPDGKWWQISTFRPDLGVCVSSEAANARAVKLVPTIPMPGDNRG